MIIDTQRSATLISPPPPPPPFFLPDQLLFMLNESPGCPSRLRQHRPENTCVHHGHPAQALAHKREPAALRAPVLHPHVSPPIWFGFSHWNMVLVFALDYICARHWYSCVCCNITLQVLHHRARERGARLHRHQVVRRAFPRIRTSGAAPLPLPPQCIP
jgi:hypothetical protein